MLAIRMTYFSSERCLKGTKEKEAKVNEVSTLTVQPIEVRAQFLVKKDLMLKIN